MCQIFRTKEGIYLPLQQIHHPRGACGDLTRPLPMKRAKALNDFISEFHSHKRVYPSRAELGGQKAPPSHANLDTLY